MEGIFNVIGVLLQDRLQNAHCWDIQRAQKRTGESWKGNAIQVLWPAGEWETPQTKHWNFVKVQWRFRKTEKLWESSETKNRGRVHVKHQKPWGRGITEIEVWKQVKQYAFSA